MTYDRTFYGTVNDAGAASAEAVLGCLLSLWPVTSAVDVGCGTGIWARTMTEHGVEDVVGVDGSYVPEDQRKLPPGRFIEMDISRPFDVGRRFDIALCLEVAEHLEQSRADGLVADLVAAAPAILFSAATPLQGGTHHVNEQWPDYWITRFAHHGWTAWDLIRPAIRYDPKVAWIYRQNVMVMLSPGHPLLPSLAPEQQLRPPAQGDVAFEYVARYILDREPGARASAQRLTRLALAKLGR